MTAVPTGVYAPQPGSKPPSSPWLGALRTGLVYLSAAWILVYTLLSVPPIEALGAWNYVGVCLLTVAVAVLGKAWRGEPYTRPTTTSRE